jgi:hypothetical protein
LGNENQNVKSIINLYKYFNNYFNNHKFNYDYKDVIGFNGDYNQEKLEPLASLLITMRKDVDDQYQDLINTLFRFSRDLKALKLLGLDYK